MTSCAVQVGAMQEQQRQVQQAQGEAAAASSKAAEAVRAAAQAQLELHQLRDAHRYASHLWEHHACTLRGIWVVVLS